MQLVCSFCFLVVCVALRAYLGTVCGSLLNLEQELLRNHEASLFEHTRKLLNLSSRAGVRLELEFAC